MLKRIMNPDRSLTMKGYCKINLHLKVKDRRLDGYHNLESIFLALAFGDTLCFELTEDKGTCDIVMDWKTLQDAGLFPKETEILPVEKNSVYQAVSLFRKQTGFNRGIRVYVEKRIPLGAGLGGGSSDAASALKALNVLANTGLGLEALQAMAETLGSDVPFFLYGAAAWVSGRGEQIVPIGEPKDLSVVLVYPGFPSNTGEAFRLLDDIRADEPYEPEEKLPEALIQSLLEPPKTWTYRNDFLSVFLTAGDPEAAGVYRKTLQDLDDAGADFIGLSGSGSTCFGIFTNGGIAKKAVQAVAGKRNFVILTFPLVHFTKEV
ncbi:MAG: 4-(cytidine 5'-diphospho)-2-C-methyl-D-erythritol kinase [Treponema sp.]|jgi:4-diphosphocytidyl-2-C-methyl-D-erythritol kinase|nr:4-(cytidine 5'-diphospho)-2-C-methyl-D-erythritol kinase [Treponema sp.]